MRKWCPHTIKSPIGHRCHSHSILKGFTFVLLQNLQRHETTKAPPPNGHPIFVNIVLLCPQFGRRNLVMGFPIPQIASDNAAGFAASISCSTPIERHNNVTQVCGDIRLEVDSESAVNQL